MKRIQVLLGAALLGWWLYSLVPPISIVIGPIPTASPAPTPTLLPPSPTPNPARCGDVLTIKDMSSTVNVFRPEIIELLRALSLCGVEIKLILRDVAGIPAETDRLGLATPVHDGTYTVDIYVYPRLAEYETMCGYRWTGFIGTYDCTIAHEFRHVYQFENWDYEDLVNTEEVEREAEAYAEARLSDTDVFQWQ